MTLRGLYGVEERVKCEKVRFVVKGAFGEQEVEHALVIPTLNLPYQSLSSDIVQRINEKENIDLHAYRNAPLNILIGQDNWHLIMSEESRQLGNSGLVISRTRLGWCVHGFLEEEKKLNDEFNVNATCFYGDELNNEERQRFENLDRIVHDYIELENLGVITKPTTECKDERAWAILEATSRFKGNEWETGLLWKPGLMPKIDSKSTALKRLYSLERKLDNNPAFAAKYYKEMQRLIDNGYATKVSKHLARPREWYVPHFGVENANKPEKVRLVFDAAAKSGGVSLNDLLETGPDLLESLLGVLLRFREFPVAVKADIKDMYLRVKLIERDRGAQRFLWRGADRNREPDIYENNSLIFGSKSSPSSAIYIKNKNAERFTNTKPEAARSIIENSYMDDYLASGNSVSEMRKRIEDVTLINSEANFFMHGWASNDSKVFDGINSEEMLSQQKQASLCNDEERVLGLYWDVKEDTFSFNVGLDKIHAELLRGLVKPTKREFFSIAMSVYDPLGIISPFTIQVKLIMQDIWRSAIGWDTKIRNEEFKSWFTWLRNLHKMRTCKIPRCYISRDSEYSNVQLHIFCDASSKAYAAVAYLRSETRDRNIHVSLVLAKARVAPKKPLTIPRLELQAAVLGAKIAAVIEKELGIKISERFFWADNKTVLFWIADEPREKQVYVANRLGQIGELSKVSEWHWVPTSLNPADDATRASGKPMTSNDRWLMGPHFLREHPDKWPKPRPLGDNEKREMNKLESRKQFIGAMFIDESEMWEVPLVLRLLGWERVRRLMIKVRECFYTWHRNALTKRRKISSSRIMANLENESALEKELEGEKILFRKIQAAYFSNEIEALKKDKELPRGSKIIRLGVFLDNEGILRAKGRINSRFVTDWLRNHPILLDATHYATKLLIASYHRRYGHANNETVINELRQQFHIVGLRTRLKWLSKHCITCRLRRAKPLNPLMAELPACRVAYRQRPFSHCGIDYFGPMFVKIGRRREKRWGVLFTCMTTRAIHVELAYTLNASSTILALRRLAGRRGFPREVYSDNGTNFVKANKELKEMIGDINKDVQKDFAASKNFKWNFNPPDAPHMGGAWERLIRSVKTALYDTLGDLAPTEEVLLTFLIEIEHMVNSRPLTHVSVDPLDEEALTPNHFLIGSSSGYLRLEKYESEIESPRKAFETAQNLTNGFWKRWLREYLPTLLPRKKWHMQTPSLKIGDIVLIVDFQAPRNTWRKGKIIDVYPNKTDGIIRVVKVRVGKKDFVRPVHKLIKIFSSL